MGKNIGLVKYIVKTPIKRPKNFFKYGGGYIGVHAAYTVIRDSQPTIATFLDAYLAYLMAKYLPPTSIQDILLPIIVGAVAAGLKWRANTF